jgi:hypothetical protein
MEFMEQYWFGGHCESPWTTGSPWKSLLESGSVVALEEPYSAGNQR